MPAYQGTYYTKTFILTYQSTGLPIDVTGWTFEMDIRDEPDNADALLTLTTAGGGITVGDGSAGEIILAITAVQTAALPVGKLHFDVLRTDVTPGPTWQFGGRFHVKQPVTR